MKKIINNPADVVPEMVNGMVRLYPQYIEKIDGTEVMVRSDKESMQRYVKCSSCRTSIYLSNT